VSWLLMATFLKTDCRKCPHCNTVLQRKVYLHWPGDMSWSLPFCQQCDPSSYPITEPVP
jgi:hypothetical protein